eukprot:TRINITY_DN7945_c0_g1_i1.p1 TRINITY_DN7945_c0_g1~~TRINITY_DN7945_c0_g1_i1.p1  ORF type:complete len:583 (+),score=92.41 TRINITY_DN7945_c0_g1_i1:140-1888(+)
MEWEKIHLHNMIVMITQKILAAQGSQELLNLCWFFDMFYMLQEWDRDSHGEAQEILNSEWRSAKIYALATKRFTLLSTEQHHQSCSSHDPMNTWARYQALKANGLQFSRMEDMFLDVEMVPDHDSCWCQTAILSVHLLYETLHMKFPLGILMLMKSSLPRQNQHFELLKSLVECQIAISSHSLGDHELAVLHHTLQTQKIGRDKLIIDTFQLREPSKLTLSFMGGVLTMTLDKVFQLRQVFGGYTRQQLLVLSALCLIPDYIMMGIAQFLSIEEPHSERYIMMEDNPCTTGTIQKEEHVSIMPQVSEVTFFDTQEHQGFVELIGSKSEQMRGKQALREVLTIQTQPPSQVTKSKNLKPCPAVLLRVPRGFESNHYLVRVCVVKEDASRPVSCFEGMSQLHIPANKVVEFKRIKITETCHKNNCSFYRLLFQLYIVVKEESLAVSHAHILSEPIRVYSHSNQMQEQTARKPIIHQATPPIVTPATTSILLVGSDFNGESCSVTMNEMPCKSLQGAPGWVVISVPSLPFMTDHTISVTLDATAPRHATPRLTASVSLMFSDGVEMFQPTPVDPFLPDEGIPARV